MSLSANVQANTSQAEAAMSRVSAWATRLQGALRGLGSTRIGNDSDMRKFQKFMEDANRNAGHFSKVTKEAFTTASGGQFASQGDRFLKNFQSWQSRLGGATRYRLEEQLAAGRAPTNLDYRRLFPGLRGEALTEHIQGVHGSLYGGLGLGMPGVGSVGSGGGLSGLARAGQWAGNVGMRTGMGAMAGGIPGAIGGFTSGVLGGGFLGSAAGLGVGAVSALLGKGFSEDDKVSKASEEFYRRSAMLGNGVRQIEEDLTKFSDGLWLAKDKTIQFAQGYAEAAHINDIKKIKEGSAEALGFSRAYGIDPHQGSQMFGSARAMGMMGSGSVSEQRQFATMIASSISERGMQFNPEKVMEELMGFMDSRAGQLGRMPVEQMGTYLDYKAAAGHNPALLGAHGDQLLGQVGSALIAPGGGMAGEVTIAEALQNAGVSPDFATQRRIRERGPLTKLANGQTAMDAVLAQIEANNPGVTEDQKSMYGADLMKMGMDKFDSLKKLNADMKGLSHTQRDNFDRGLEAAGLRPEDVHPGAIKGVMAAANATDGSQLKQVAESYSDKMTPAQVKELKSTEGDVNAFQAKLIEIIAKIGPNATHESKMEQNAVDQLSEFQKMGAEFRRVREILGGVITESLKGIYEVGLSVAEFFGMEKPETKAARAAYDAEEAKVTQAGQAVKDAKNAKPISKEEFENYRKNITDDNHFTAAMKVRAGVDLTRKDTYDDYLAKRETHIKSLDDQYKQSITQRDEAFYKIDEAKKRRPWDEKKKDEEKKEDSSSGKSATFNPQGELRTGGKAKPVSRDTQQTADTIYNTLHKRAIDDGMDEKAAHTLATVGLGQATLEAGADLKSKTLFGVKAGKGQKSFSASTQEFEGGKGMVRQNANFADFNDPNNPGAFAENSANGYYDFLKNNPKHYQKYLDAVRNGASPEEAAAVMGKTGYATAPKYGEQLQGVIDSPSFDKKLSGNPSKAGAALVDVVDRNGKALQRENKWTDEQLAAYKASIKDGVSNGQKPTKETMEKAVEAAKATPKPAATTTAPKPALAVTEAAQTAPKPPDKPDTSVLSAQGKAVLGKVHGGMGKMLRWTKEQSDTYDRIAIENRDEQGNITSEGMKKAKDALYPKPPQQGTGSNNATVSGQAEVNVNISVDGKPVGTQKATVPLAGSGTRKAQASGQIRANQKGGTDAPLPPAQVGRSPEARMAA